MVRCDLELPELDAVSELLPQLAARITRRRRAETPRALSSRIIPCAEPFATGKQGSDAGTFDLHLCHRARSVHPLPPNAGYAGSARCSSRGAAQHGFQLTRPILASAPDGTARDCVSDRAAASNPVDERSNAAPQGLEIFEFAIIDEHVADQIPWSVRPRLGRLECV